MSADSKPSKARKGRVARRRRQAAISLAVGLALTALAMLAYATDVGERMELSTVDARFSVRGDEPAPPGVVLVGIDDETFGDLRERWPFPRSYHARVIDQLRRAGAKVIVYDVQFTEPSRDPRQDLALYNAAGRARNVVFATTEVGKNGSTNVLGGDENLKQISAIAGNGLFSNDSDGAIRRVPASTNGLESLSYAAVRKAGGSRLPQHGVWIDYAGGPGTVQEIPFWRIYRGRFDPASVKGKTVVVGPVAPTLQDLHDVSTSDGEPMAGGEIQAAAIATLQRGEPLSAVPEWVGLLIVFVLGMLVPMLGVRLRPVIAIAIGAAVALAYLVVAQLAFNGGTIMPVVYPIVALALTSIGALTVYYFTEVRERRRLRALFGRFVPEAVVDTVVDRAEDDLRLIGEELEATVMFTDLRGFTSFSESLAPPEVFDILTYYHEQMTQAVLDHGGTLVCYMGDGLMVVFGAPIPQEDHAQRAFDAALEMIGPRLDDFNDWLRDQGHPAFRMGVGLNTGLVMSGNVGSDRRLEYSTIGDIVNTAARIEGLTKEYGHMLLLSGSTREALGERGAELEFVTESAIRGRERTIELWTAAPSRAGHDEAATPVSAST